MSKTTTKRNTGRYGIATITVQETEMIGNDVITYEVARKKQYAHPAQRPRRRARYQVINPLRMAKRRSQHTK
ncbi:MAG: hypothetical protein ILP11_01245 [Alphaproteobacteria bacterium]|nr:hypothetical protein [Alphaproteobacteria bacterium]